MRKGRHESENIIYYFSTLKAFVSPDLMFYSYCLLPSTLSTFKAQCRCCFSLGSSVLICRLSYYRPKCIQLTILIHVYIITKCFSKNKKATLRFISLAFCGICKERFIKIPNQLYIQDWHADKLFLLQMQHYSELPF